MHATKLLSALPVEKLRYRIPIARVHPSLLILLRQVDTKNIDLGVTRCPSLYQKVFGAWDREHLTFAMLAQPRQPSKGISLSKHAATMTMMASGTPNLEHLPFELMLIALSQLSAADIFKAISASPQLLQCYLGTKSFILRNITLNTIYPYNMPLAHSIIMVPTFDSPTAQFFKSDGPKSRALEDEVKEWLKTIPSYDGDTELPSGKTGSGEAEGAKLFKLCLVTDSFVDANAEQALAELSDMMSDKVMSKIPSDSGGVLSNTERARMQRAVLNYERYRKSLMVGRCLNDWELNHFHKVFDAVNMMSLTRWESEELAAIADFVY